jgi:hypothetical protein
MERVCGFVVVRKPEYAKNDLLKPKMRVGEKTYQGVDRLRWEDFEVAFYDRCLPSEMLPIWQDLRRDSADFTGLYVLKDYQKAQRALEYSGEEKSELIAVWSPQLEQIKGASPCHVSLKYLGLDCVVIGEWSLILDGVYFKPECFPEAVSQLNEHGLLTSDTECDSVLARYLDLASSEIVEPVMEQPRATNIRVFKAGP